MRKWGQAFFIALLTFIFVCATLEDEGKIQIKGSITDATFSPDGKLLITASSKGIDIWEIPTNKHLKNIDDRTVLSVAISPNGKTLAYGTIEGKVKMCSVPDCEVITEAIAGNGHIRQIIFTQDGELVITNLLNAFDLSGKLKFQLKNESPANAIALSQDNKMLASAHANGSVLLWNIKRKKVVQTLSAHPREASEVAFIPFVEELATASLEGVAKTWNLKDMIEVRTFNHQSDILSLAVSPQGRILAIGTQDGKVTLWDVRTGENLGSFIHWPNIAVDVLVFSPNGDTLISASWGLVKRWKVK